MKKLSIYSFATLLMVAMFVSCGNKYQAKVVELNNQDDSINYAFGLLNGAALQEQYVIPEESENEALEALLSELDKSFATDAEDNMFEKGKKIGYIFKSQEKEGFLGEADFVFDSQLAKAGIENELKGESLMSMEEAQEYIQNVMFEIQMRRMASQNGFNPEADDSAAEQEDVVEPVE